MAEPLLILPTLMADARAYLPIINRQLPRRPVQVALVPDAPDLGEAAKRVLAQAPRQFALFGHGLGALVAMHVVLDAPQRVTRLILMGGTGQSETPATAAAQEELLVKANTGALGAAILQATGVSGQSKSAERDRLEEQVLAMSFDLGAGLFEPQLRLIQRRPDIQAALRKITCPTLIVGGVRDPMFPVRGMEFMANIMPAAKLHVVKGAGAWLPLEAPERCAEMVDEFLPDALVLG